MDVYTDCAHARQVPPDQRNPVSSIYDFLVALGIETMVEVAALFEQADRLFACRFRAGERVMPVIEESVLQKARATTVRTCDHPSPHGLELAYGATFRQEMAERHFAPCMHTLRALRHCPFALDVFLWDACYAARAPQGPPPACSRLAAYYALADRPSRPPSVSEILAFERDLATVREKRRGTDSSSSSFIAAGYQYRRRTFQQGDGLAPRHGGVVRQEIVEPVARFEVLHQDSHRNPGPGKHGSSPKDVRVPVNTRIGHLIFPGWRHCFAFVAREG